MAGERLSESLWRLGLCCPGPFPCWDSAPIGPDGNRPHVTKAGATGGLPKVLQGVFRVRVPGPTGTARPPAWALPPLTQPSFIIFLQTRTEVKMARSAFQFSSAHQSSKKMEGLMVPRTEEHSGSRCRHMAGSTGLFLEGQAVFVSVQKTDRHSVLFCDPAVHFREHFV